MQTQSKPVDIAQVEPPKRRSKLPPLGLIIALDDFPDEFVEELGRGMRAWGWTVFLFGGIAGALVTLCVTLLIH